MPENQISIQIEIVEQTIKFQNFSPEYLKKKFQDLKLMEYLNLVGFRKILIIPEKL
jgi:hypothetical protein